MSILPFRLPLVSRLVAIGSAAVLIYSSPEAFAQDVSVPAVFHRQEHNLSCEVATLKMALQVHGINVSENELIAQLPFDQTPRQHGIWGDPNYGFVGNIDGRMMVTGYGVHWDPIAQLGAHYLSTTVLRHSSAAALAKHIAAGNPVIIWGNYGTPTAYTWQTPGGNTIKTIAGEHTRLVYGFDGPTAAPTHFYLMDPLVGQLRWSTPMLMDNWSSLGHMGVVVTKHPRWVRVPGETKVWEISRDGSKRHWITTWATLLRRGGAAHVRPIDDAAITTYRVGQPIN